MFFVSGAESAELLTLAQSTLTAVEPSLHICLLEVETALTLTVTPFLVLPATISAAVNVTVCAVIIVVMRMRHVVKRVRKLFFILYFGFQCKFTQLFL